MSSAYIDYLMRLEKDFRSRCMGWYFVYIPRLRSLT